MTYQNLLKVFSFSSFIFGASVCCHLRHLLGLLLWDPGGKWYSSKSTLKIVCPWNPWERVPFLSVWAGAKLPLHVAGRGPGLGAAGTSPWFLWFWEETGSLASCWLGGWQRALGTGNGEAELEGKQAGKGLWKMPPALSLRRWVRQSMWKKPRCFLVQGRRVTGWDSGLAQWLMGGLVLGKEEPLDDLPAFLLMPR